MEEGGRVTEGSSSVESNGRRVEPAASGGGGFVFGQNLADRASNFSETMGASTDSATSSMTKGTQHSLFSQ